MPLTQQIQDFGFNTGINYTITLTDGNGVLYNLGRIVSFNAKPETVLIESKSINKKGYVKRSRARHGWKGTIVCDRVDGTQDQIEANQEAGYHAGLLQQYFTMMVQIANPSPLDPLTILEFDDCEVFESDEGTAKLDERVEVMLEFTAEERIKIQ